MNTLDALFQWLLAASLRASVVAVVVLSLRGLLRPWLSAWWRHALWLPVVMVLILPAFPVLPWSPFPAEKTAAPVPTVVEPDFAPAPAVPETLPVAASPEQPRFTTMNLLAVVWLCGAGAFLIVGATGYRKSLKRAEWNGAEPEPKLIVTIQMAAAKVGLKGLPRVLVSPEVESPAVTGLLRPLLLLPAGFPQGLSDNEARLILLHELTHLKRRDLSVNWLLCLLQAVHWFNPVMWFSFSRLRADREAACDAQVLALEKEDLRADYGHALLKLQTATPPFGHGLAFVGFFKRGMDLHTRIREISRYRRVHPAWNAAAAVVVGVCTLFGITKAEPPAPAPAEGKSETTAKKDAGALPVQQVVANRLREIVIPEVDFADTTLEEAVAYLRLVSTADDPGTGTPKGINFVIQVKNGVQLPRMKSLRLKNVPLAIALKYVCDQTRMSYRVDEAGSVILAPQTLGDGAAPPTAASSGQAYLNNKLKAIVIPSIQFEDTTLEEAINLLRKRSVELDVKETDPAKKGVNFVIRQRKGEEAPGANPEEGSPKIKGLRLQNVPLGTALKYIADQTRMTCTVDDYAVTLVPSEMAK
ncbi:hypothetical protein KBB96_04255 [Luteolibacter ambystomatis]|uniref:Peptidase M56 domain-containing protein n=1 Tax=Luteolibacter ambystomatis TaxID=2824561 RepID=A0A975PGA8_9BACT|nr:M56 family metallopeptidase [Luteolibacter ambystomatis]QUE52106.1 hypothetical protein KBB96_04255 [Luteolibacter ambystomatis]